MLALLAEICLLVSPFFMQVLIDEVLVKGDQPLLQTLAIGFGALLVFQIIAQIMRQFTLQYLGQTVSFKIASRLFSRMMKLQSSFFSNRQLGDIQHRVRSLDAVRAFLTSGAIAIVMDAIFFSILLVIMGLYSLTLSLIGLGVVALFLVWRRALFGTMKRAAGDLLVAEGNEQTHLLESLRSISTIKTLALESKREAAMRSKMVRKVNAHIRTGNIGIVESNISSFILEGGRLVVLVVAATLIQGGEMSIGMLTAFASYFGMFSTRARALVDYVIQFKLLSVPMQRISEMAYAPTEAEGEDGGRNILLRGQVRLDNAYFQYGASEGRVLNGASFLVEPGEFVAIAGPSGAGKTTILRLLAGLNSPNAGSVLFDGRPIETWHKKTLREQVAVVLQDDVLFQGSLAENIASFDSEIDMKRVRWAAGAASIAADIEAFPMGYETLVGDMGSTLSGGQKQRVILARALYRRPKVLLLDEATSHLDVGNETVVLNALAAQKMTRIVIAHRAETIDRADRVLMVHQGQLIEARPKITEEAEAINQTVC